MVLADDVRAVARQWGIDPALVQAVVNAEGDIVRAVECTVAVSNRAQALEVVCRSAVHAMCDFLKGGGGTAAQFVAFWGHRWAPIGVANDPHETNANWIPNVTKLWLGVNA